jgi:transposase
MSYAVAMNKKVRPRRDFQELEQRRKRAGRYFEAGKLSLAEIARELNVSRQSVSRWYAEWKRGGAAALRGAVRAGRKPRLQPEQLEQLDPALREGARAHGFPADLWTLPRIAKVIERLTGVHYHPGHVWKILKTMRWNLTKAGHPNPIGRGVNIVLDESGRRTAEPCRFPPGFPGRSYTLQPEVWLARNGIRTERN